MSFQVRNDTYTADNNSVQNKGYSTKTVTRNRNTNGYFSRATHLKKAQSSRQSAHVDSVRKREFLNSKDEMPAQNLQTKKFTKSKANPKNIAINKKICQTHSYVEILRIWKESKADFDGVNIATAIHRLTKSQAKLESQSLQDNEKSLLDELTNAARANISKFKAQELSNILWAFATLSIKDKKLFEEFAKEIEKRNLINFKPQEISNILWAFATLGIKDKIFLDFAKEIEKRNLTSFTPQNIANILWAFATLSIKDEKLFDDFAKDIEKRNLSFFKPQDFANILWAFATLSIKGKKLFADFPNEIKMRNLSFFKPQDFANILWAFATLGIKNKKLFDVFANEIEKRNLSFFTPQDFANILWAFATLGIKDKIFHEFAKDIEKRNLSFFDPQAIANILWAFATLRIKDKIFSDFANVIEKRNLSFFTPQNIANILWAYSVTKFLPIEQILFLIKQASKFLEDDMATLKDIELSQLLQVRLALQQEFPDQQIPWGEKLENLLEVAKRELIHTKYTSSDLHKDVADSLGSLVNFETEKFVDFVSVDILLEQDKTVIEIHGPSHYLHKSHELYGKSLLKLRLLQNQGYTAVVVPYWEWNALETLEEKKDYLKARLEQIVSSTTPVIALSLEDGIVNV